MYKSHCVLPHLFNSLLCSPLDLLLTSYPSLYYYACACLSIVSEMPCTLETLTEVVHSTKHIKIQGFSTTSAMADADFFASGRWKVGGYDWEVRVLPNSQFIYSQGCGVTLRLYCFSVPSPGGVKAKFSCRLIDPIGKLKPFEAKSSASAFKSKRSGDCCYTGDLKTRLELETSGYLKDDAFTVECTLKVLRELIPTKVNIHRPAQNLLPSTILNHHLGDLLRKGTGADVTFDVSGESFAAHKAILASRSPVFTAEFFGHMKEKHSHIVEVKDMEPAVFGAMLRFIYTDSAPELEDGTAVVALAQHLLVAADRYGIDRLKLICEDKLYDSGIS